MPSTREMRLRIRSVKSISQVTRALETVAASKVRRAVQSVTATKPYSEKAWKVLIHLAREPGHTNLHPLLTERDQVNKILVVFVSGDRGLAGAYNVNVLRNTLGFVRDFEQPVSFIAVGRKGRDMLVRRRFALLAEFSNIASPPTFLDISPIGQLAVDEFLAGNFDQVYLAYTDYVNMINQVPVFRKLLPLDVKYSDTDNSDFSTTHHSKGYFQFEPGPEEILSEIVPRFTALQIYQSILSAQASEHAARMVAMRNATDNANELIAGLELEYNKMRQQIITNEMLDITSGAEALTNS